MEQLKFIIRTLGCKVNQYEEQVLRENLLWFGFQETVRGDADIFIVNSCTVTNTADVKTRKLMRKAKKDNPNVKVFVTGCYAVLKEDIETLQSLPEVDMVVPAKDKAELPHILNSFFGMEKVSRHVKEQVSGFSSHTRAFLKIQDGCDQRCSYCKVNIVRGASESRGEHDVLDEIKRLVNGGYKEIVLTGICIGAWKGTEGQDLAVLLKKIDKIEKEFRIRISSIEPNHITEDLIEIVASSAKICNHFHVPLQSGSDRILNLMNRRYNTEQFRKIVGNIRKAIPLVGLSMDIIAGFPTEKESDFDETMQFLNEIKPSRVHIFKYSDRKGTPAFDMSDKVASNIAKARVEQLINIGDQLQKEFCGRFIGNEVEVLVEELSKGEFLEGYTSEYVRTSLNGFDGSIGDIVRVKVDGMDEDLWRLIV